jgi:hypothetical protein
LTNLVDLTPLLEDQPVSQNKAKIPPLCPRGSSLSWTGANGSADKGIAIMARNIGPEDRVVRIVLAVGLAVLAYLGVLPGVASIIMIVLAVYLLLSGLFARCIFYKMIDVDTSIQEQPYSTTDDRAGF